MNLCVVSTYNGTKEDYLKLYESFKDDIAKYTDGFEMGFVRDGKVIIVANVTAVSYTHLTLPTILRV